MPPLRRVLAVVVAVVVAAGASTSSLAAEYDLGGLSVGLDTRLTYGATFRAQRPDQATVCVANGGTAFGCNADDGTLNYERGIVGNVARIRSDLRLSHGPLSGFLRLHALKDFEADNGSRARTPLGGEARELVGSDVDILDAYGTYRFSVGSGNGDLRVGKLVLNWGESTFIPNGINAVNPIDVTKARLPGAELSDALAPVPMVAAALDVSANLSLEAFYQLDWDHSTLDPVGTFFSTADSAGPDARRYQLGFGAFSDLGSPNPGLGGLGEGGRFDPDFLAVRRAADRNPRDGGQFGLALRWFAPRLNNSEFGLYYLRYHSRLPLGGATTGTQAGIGNAAAASAAGSCFGGVQAGCPVPVATTAGNAAASAATGALVGAATGAGDPDGSARKGVVAASNGARLGARAVSDTALDLYSRTTTYFLEYPEHIDLLGLSFNTELGRTGITVQGEIAHRRDVPLQIDDQEIFVAGASPLGFLDPAVLDNQITRGAALGPERTVSGVLRRSVSQIQMTATRALGRGPGWSQLILLGEVGWMHVHDMPSTSRLRLEGAGTFVSGNPAHARPPGVDPAKPLGGVHAGKPAAPADHFADQDSWGYRLAGFLEMDPIFAGVRLLPRFLWQHDVFGNSPAPTQVFVEGRRSLTLALRATIHSHWEADVSYTNFFGAGARNLLNDRDFVQASLSYSFW